MSVDPKNYRAENARERMRKNTDKVLHMIADSLTQALAVADEMLPTVAPMLVAECSCATPSTEAVKELENLRLDLAKLLITLYSQTGTR